MPHFFLYLTSITWTRSLYERAVRAAFGPYDSVHSHVKGEDARTRAHLHKLRVRNRVESANAGMSASGVATGFSSGASCNKPRTTFYNQTAAAQKLKISSGLDTKQAAVLAEFAEALCREQEIRVRGNVARAARLSDFCKVG